MALNCSVAVSNILSVIPDTETELINELKSFYERIVNKTDNNFELWAELIDILKNLMSIPIEDWEFEVLSITTMLPVDELKKMYNELKEKYEC